MGRIKPELGGRGRSLVENFHDVYSMWIQKQWSIAYHYNIVGTIDLVLSPSSVDSFLFCPLTLSPHSSGHPVTEDMCVRHFLIKSDMEGVKLHGWNERPFGEEK